MATPRCWPSVSRSWISFRRGLRPAEIDVVHAQALLVVEDAERRRRGEAFAHAGAQAHAGRRVGRIEGDRAGRLEDLAAQTVGAIHLALAGDELVGQAIVRHQVELFRLRHVQPHGAGIRTQRRLDAVEKALAQGFQRCRLAEEGGHVVEDAELAVALGQAVRLGLDALFQRAIDAFQMFGHVVEAGGQAAQLVVAGDRQAHRQVVAGHALDTGMQRPDRANDQAVEIANEQAGADNGQYHQGHLHAAQQVGVVGVAALHGQHQFVDAVNEGFELLVEAIGRQLAFGADARQIGRHQRAHLGLPGLADFGQAILHLVVAGRRQRPCRVAQLQVAQHLVELFQFAVQHRANGRLLGPDSRPRAIRWPMR
jgi:hypothetical protein